MVEGVVVAVPFLRTNSPGPIPENSCLPSAPEVRIRVGVCVYGLGFMVYGLWFKV